MNRFSLVSHELNQFDRVRKMTPAHVNRKLDQKVDRQVRDIFWRGPDAIRSRLHHINTEWDMDRIFMLGLSAALIGGLFAARKNQRWLRAPVVHTSFLFLYATLGWAPPVPILRRFGFRTRYEIQAEREALLDQLLKWQEPVS